MKKIVAAFDGLKYAESTRDYAIYLAKQTKTHLVGVFMDDPTYTGYKIFELVGKEGTDQSKLKKFEAVDEARRQAAAKDFEKSCQAHSLEFSLHHDRKIAINELKHESIYTDLMVMHSGETLTHYPEKPPTRFIRELLGDAECPVLVVPEKYRPIEKIILLYDGEPSSVYAVKVFSYLLPQLKHLETEVVSIKPLNTSLHLPDNQLMKEFMKRHFPKAKYKVMKGRAEDEIVSFLKQTSENALVVLGAYRRITVAAGFGKAWQTYL